MFVKVPGAGRNSTVEFEPLVVTDGAALSSRPRPRARPSIALTWSVLGKGWRRDERKQFTVMIPRTPEPNPVRWYCKARKKRWPIFIETHRKPAVPGADTREWPQPTRVLRQAPADQLHHGLNWLSGQPLRVAEVNYRVVASPPPPSPAMIRG